MIRFIEWLAIEAKSQRNIYYHGTGSQLLPIILSQGLIPNPKKRTWDKDSDSNFFHPSRASLEGIYVTTNLLTATSSAWKAAKRGVHNEIIVVMDLHPYSMAGDEDDHMNSAVVPVPGMLTTEYSLSGVYFPWKVLNTPQLFNMKQAEEYGDYWIKKSRTYVDNARKEYIKKFMTHIGFKIKKIHPELEKRIISLAEEGFEIAMERQVSYISDYDYNRYCYDNWDGKCPSQLKKPDKHVAESKWSEFLNRVTKTLKQTSYSDNDFNNTGRVLEPIGFTGKNKIVCIIEVMPYAKGNTSIVIRYGVPPQKLIDDWQRFQGKWNPVENT